MHPPAALRRTLTVTIIPVTFASGAAAPGFDDGEKVDVRVAPDHDHANQMRAKVLSGHCGAWELLAWEVASERWMEPRSAAGS